MKILLIRFSALGDILLTTPVLRCLKEQGGHELHFLTKKENAFLIEANPYLTKIHYFANSLSQTTQELQKEKFDYVVDLHKNIRSLRIRIGLGKLCSNASSYPKHSLSRIYATLFHNKQLLPKSHVVDRYFQAVKKLGIKNDHNGLTYIPQTLPPPQINKIAPYIAIAVGSKHFTKQIPNTLLAEIISNAPKVFVLLGDKNDALKAQMLLKLFPTPPPNVINLCGDLNFDQSAQVIAHAQGVISGDSSLMHLAAALNKNLISVWGSTVPQFGMYPYYAKNSKALCYTLENNEIKCRPCHKHGRKKCPKNHFDCMNNLSTQTILDLLNQF